MGEEIRIEQEDGVALVTLDRPATLNALDHRLLEALDAAFGALRSEAGLRCVILTGTGKAFVAGADIAAMQKFSTEEAQAFSRFGQEVFERIASFPRPVIAAVNGFALGGGLELALACDLRIGSEKAKLGQPEVGLGVIPGFGGTQRLPRLVGRSRAKLLLFSGESLGANQALALGLLDEVVPAEALLERCRTLARTISLRSPLAVELCKELVDQGLVLPLDRALELETERFGQTFATADQEEGMAAFLEKRTPRFQGF